MKAAATSAVRRRFGGGGGLIVKSIVCEAVGGHLRTVRPPPAYGGGAVWGFLQAVMYITGETCSAETSLAEAGAVCGRCSRAGGEVYFPEHTYTQTHTQNATRTR